MKALLAVQGCKAVLLLFLPSWQKPPGLEIWGGGTQVLQAGWCRSPALPMSLCCSRRWQSHFLGHYAAAALCKTPLSPIKCWFSTGLTSILVGAAGPSGAGRAELGTPAPTS